MTLRGREESISSCIQDVASWPVYLNCCIYSELQAWQLALRSQPFKQHLFVHRRKFIVSRFTHADKIKHIPVHIPFFWGCSSVQLPDYVSIFTWIKHTTLTNVSLVLLIILKAAVLVWSRSPKFARLLYAQEQSAPMRAIWGFFLTSVYMWLFLIRMHLSVFPAKGGLCSLMKNVWRFSGILHSVEEDILVAFQLTEASWEEIAPVC